MARITASVFTSHVPAIGAAIDHGRTREPYWQPVFKGYEFSKQWMTEHRPDVIFLVYNDHASAFSLELIPTFAIGTAAEFRPADEGYGARPVATVVGDPDLASHIAQSVIQDDFDLAIANRMDVDHGLTVPLSLMCGKLDPVKDAAALEDAFQVLIVQTLMADPYPSLEGIQTLIDLAAPTNPAVLEVKPEQLVDMTILDRLHANGFFDGLE